MPIKTCVLMHHRFGKHIANLQPMSFPFYKVLQNVFNVLKFFTDKCSDNLPWLSLIANSQMAF